MPLDVWENRLKSGSRTGARNGRNRTRDWMSTRRRARCSIHRPRVLFHRATASSVLGDYRWRPVLIHPITRHWATWCTTRTLCTRPCPSFSTPIHRPICSVTRVSTILVIRDLHLICISFAYFNWRHGRCCFPLPNSLPFWCWLTVRAVFAILLMNS